jgi:hypothetical protein
MAPTAAIVHVQELEAVGQLTQDYRWVPDAVDDGQPI